MIGQDGDLVQSDVGDLGQADGVYRRTVSISGSREGSLKSFHVLSPRHSEYSAVVSLYQDLIMRLNYTHADTHGARPPGNSQNKAMKIVVRVFLETIFDPCKHKIFG